MQAEIASSRGFCSPGVLQFAKRGHADRFQYYEKGDISNVVSKGTFLMSVDTSDLQFDFPSVRT